VTQRLFVAVDCASLAEPLADLQTVLPDADSLRPTDPEQAHVTLQFLGETADDRVETVADGVSDAVGAADVDPFELMVAGVGAFPSREYISVVWAGTADGSTQLDRLHEAVVDTTTGLGFDEPGHAFTPHVTLARMDDARGKTAVREFLDRDPTVGTVAVEAVELKRSLLGEGGPRYETVRRIEL
jgi:2'-5' RNA ligase